MQRCMDELKTERSFYSQATWVIDVLILLFITCLYIQAFADVRSTGAGIKCLYCRDNSEPPVTDTWGSLITVTLALS